MPPRASLRGKAKDLAMSATITQIYERLRSTLSDLDALELHLAAIHVAKAIEVIEMSNSEINLRREKIFDPPNIDRSFRIN